MRGHEQPHQTSGAVKESFLNLNKRENMSSRRPMLHEIVACIPDRVIAYDKMVEELNQTLTKRDHLFSGFNKSLIYRDEGRQTENSVEDKPLAGTVSEKLDYSAAEFAKALDLFISRDVGNATATADIVVNDVVLAQSVPATTLLTLEQRLTKLRSVYASVPTLDPSVEWVPNDQDGKGRFKSKSSVNTTKTEKKLEFKVLYAATDKHPAQIEKWFEDKVVADIKTVRHSGAMTVADKAIMLQRFDLLLSAIKQARMRANSIEVTPSKIGAQLFAYIHGAAA